MKGGMATEDSVENALKRWVLLKDAEYALNPGPLSDVGFLAVRTPGFRAQGVEVGGGFYHCFT